MRLVVGIGAMIIIQLVLSLFIGNLTVRIMKIKCGLIEQWLLGIFWEWTVFQIIAVPAIYFKATLSFVKTIWSIIIMIAVSCECVCLIKTKDIMLRRKKLSYVSRRWILGGILAVFCAGMIGFQLYMTEVALLIDKDDARFVANAVAAWDSDTMLLVHPNTGEMLTEPLGEMKKDAVAPWMIFIAMLAQLVGVHPTIMAHSVFPVILVLMGYGVYWCLSGCFWKEDTIKRLLFLNFISLAILYGGKSIYTTETFFLTRIWQGKAIVCAIMLPFLIVLFMERKASEEWKKWDWLIMLTAIATCMLSGVGIIFSPILIGCFVVVQAIQNKSIYQLIHGGLMCLPCVLYGVLYLR